MKRAFYSDSIANFLTSDEKFILGILADANHFALNTTQKDAWLDEIRILKSVLPGYDGSIYFEFAIPRMGRRIDVVLLIGAVVFVLEFKVFFQHKVQFEIIYYYIKRNSYAIISLYKTI